MVVDGGKWGGANYSQDWSSNVTGTAYRPVSNAFSGYISTLSNSDVPDHLQQSLHSAGLI